jgi:hypothetical protein
LPNVPPGHIPEHVEVGMPEAAPYAPTSHEPVHAASVSPVVFPNSPAEQFEHALTLPRLYLPVAHSAHGTLPPGENCPGGHTSHSAA